MKHPCMPNLIVNYPHKIRIFTSKHKRLKVSKSDFSAFAWRTLYNQEPTHFSLLFYIWHCRRNFLHYSNLSEKIRTDQVWCCRNSISILKYRTSLCVSITTPRLHGHFHLPRTIHFTGTPVAWSTLKKRKGVKFLVENSNAVIVPALLKPKYRFRGTWKE